MRASRAKRHEPAPPRKQQNAREGQLAALLLQVVAAQYPSAYRDPWGCTCPGGNCQEIGCQQMRLKDMDVAVRDLCMLLDVHEEKDGHTRHWKLVYKDLSGNLVSDGR